MGERDPLSLERIRGRLEKVPELRARVKHALYARPAPRSCAERDLALPDGRYVGIYATHALTAALDDLNTWRILAHGPELPIRSHLLLLRAALEGSLLCRWLVEAKERPARRVSRGLAARRDDQEERGRFEASFPDRGAAIARLLGPRGRTALERLAELDEEDRAKARTAARIPPSGFADTTSLMAKHGIEPAFRLLSGLAHSKEWSLIVTEMTIDPDADQTPGVGQGRIAISLPWAEIFTNLALDSVAWAVVDMERYRLVDAAQARRAPKG
jgi:hypothetical protein